MITPMQMYWLLKLDDIGGLCVYAISAFCVLLAISGMVYCTADYEQNEKGKNALLYYYT